jgi:MoxR-like ATPase
MVKLSNGMAEGITKGLNELSNASRDVQSEITEALEKRVRRVYTMTLLTLPHKFKWPLLAALVVAAGWRWGTKTKPGAHEAGKSSDK